MFSFRSPHRYISSAVRPRECKVYKNLVHLEIRHHGKACYSLSRIALAYGQ
jgi:hypothetical protein